MQRLCNNLPTGWRHVIRKSSIVTCNETKIKSKNNNSDATKNSNFLQRILNADVSQESLQATSVVQRTPAEVSTVSSRLVTFFKEFSSKKNEGERQKLFNDLSLWFTGVIAIYGGILSHTYLKKDKDECPFKLQKNDALLRMLWHAVYSDHLILHVNPKKSLPAAKEDSSGHKPQTPLEKFDEAAATFEVVSDACYGCLLNQYAMEYRKSNKHEKAFELFQSAATYGHVPSIYNLGLCYEYGHGVKTSLHKAAEYYNEAASLGHKEAMFNIATFHYEGKGLVPGEDRSTGFDFMKTAADKGLVQAQSFIALQFSQSGKWTEAFKYFKMAAEQKDRASIYNLAVCFDKGIGVKVDNKQAMKYYHEGADMGDVLSQFCLGDSYHRGLRGVNKDLHESLKWFKMASYNGHEDAKSRMTIVENEITADEYERKLVGPKNIFSLINLSPSFIESKYEKSFLLPTKRSNWKDAERMFISGV